MAVAASVSWSKPLLLAVAMLVVKPEIAVVSGRHRSNSSSNTETEQGCGQPWGGRGLAQGPKGPDGGLRPMKLLWGAAASEDPPA